MPITIAIANSIKSIVGCMPRADPFEAVWSEARSWLEQEPDITGTALFDRIREHHPGEFAPGQLRTLQRRVQEWWQAMGDSSSRSRLQHLSQKQTRS